MIKRCPTCELVFENAEDVFDKNRNAKCGLHWQCRGCKKNYSKSKTAKASQKKRDAKRYLKYPDKPKARDAARRKWGPASRLACGVMGCEINADELHHINYDLPLDVIPLCEKHHTIIHMEEHGK